MRPVLWAGVPGAAGAVRQLCPQAAADTIARAGEICGHTFLFRDHWEMEPTREPVHFDGPVVWDAVPAGDPEWIYALNRHTIFVNLGKAWQYTGQARYLNAFVSLLEDWLDRMPRTPASENTTWRALEAGLRPENWLRALGLFGQAVPEPLCRRVDESLARHGAYLAEVHGPFQRLSNWGAIQSHGLFLIGLWLGRADWQELALGRLAENLRHAVLPDGVQWEQSPMYHCEVLHAVLDTLLLAQRNGELGTCWQAAPGRTEAALTFTFPQPETVSCLVLGEYLPLGQHIEAGCIEADGRPVASFTVVGHKRICRFAPVTAQRFTVRITAARAEPALRLAAAYR